MILINYERKINSDAKSDLNSNQFHRIYRVYRKKYEMIGRVLILKFCYFFLYTL